MGWRLGLGVGIRIVVKHEVRVRPVICVTQIAVWFR